VSVATYPLSWDGHWHLHGSGVDGAWTPRTRAVVVVNPNNPTGSYLEVEERRTLEGLCASRGAALISDEVFWDYSFGDVSRRAQSLAVDGECLGFSLGGVSKSLALPQLKLGWIAVSGPEILRTEAMSRLEVIADTYLSVSTPVQVAAPSLLARVEVLQRPVQERVMRNLAALRTAVSGDSPASLLEPEAGWSAVLRVPATVPEEERTVGLVEEVGVLVHPGFFFDFPNEAYLVLSLLPRPAEFDEGIARVLGSLRG
jgi:alanine-synthesizing transaminase